MEQLICRTCLKANLSRNDHVKVFGLSEPKQTSINDMLEMFIPEMGLDISDGDVVMCLVCAEALRNAFQFKNVCLRTEETIYDYLNCYNLKLGTKINLSNVIKHRNGSAVGNEGVGLDVTNNLLKDGQTINICSDQSSSESLNVDAVEALGDKETGAKRKRRASSKKSKTAPEHGALKRSYTCDLCEYKAYRWDLLKTHKQKHDGTVKEYKCDLCMYSTLRKRALERHLFTHKGKSRHRCENCEKTFAEKYQLNLHAITHTGQELPHKCVECGKGYLTKSYLKQHMETAHLVEAQPNCQLCSRRNCEHLSSRSYKCSRCEASFSDKRGLDAHEFTHTGGELPYQCAHCGFSTAWKGNLKKHLRKKTLNSHILSL